MRFPQTTQADVKPIGYSPQIDCQALLLKTPIHNSLNTEKSIWYLHKAFMLHSSRKELCTLTENKHEHQSATNLLI